jgi:hypothetical protein
MLRLNTMLTKRGFKNLDPHFGFGKLNAKWQRDDVIIRRYKKYGDTKISIRDSNSEIIFTLPYDEDHIRDYILNEL